MSWVMAKNNNPPSCEEVLCEISATGWMDAYRVLEWCDNEWSDWEGNIYNNVVRWQLINRK